MIGAKINSTKPKIANTMPSGLPLLSLLRPARPPVQNMNRRKKSESSAMIPTIVTASVITNMS